ncbi:MAG: hypothetical protein M3413_07975 [Bacteroidota bacterium]|nr:hypothetical protein [Bacteroidota bacterium]
MKFLSLQPFVPSGKDFCKSKNFFVDLGFTISWEAGDFIGFVKDDCRFILQKYDHKEFAENLMINVAIDNADTFFNLIKEKQLEQKYGIKLGNPTNQPYGKEVNVIDLAGVCWHFVQ